MLSDVIVAQNIADMHNTRILCAYIIRRSCACTTLHLYSSNLIFKLLNLNFALRKHCLDVKFATHRLNIATHGGEVHVSPLFRLGHSALINFQGVCEGNLSEISRFSNLV